nr:ADP-ribosylglycohydrolase family protein [Acidiferrobacter sp.]
MSEDSRAVRPKIKGRKPQAASLAPQGRGAVPREATGKQKGRIVHSQARSRQTGRSVHREQKEAEAVLMRSRFVGCLLGGAVGDALGAPVEFMKRTEILERFGAKGITAYAPAYGRIGAITDDTQMTLFTAEGLIRTWVRLCTKGIASVEGMTAYAYVRWYKTQGLRPHPHYGDREEAGWLFQQEALHARRGPGETCLSAIRHMTVMGDPAQNDSKGCGGVMRIAPVGLVMGQGGSSPSDTFALGAKLAALTHGHPTGSLAAGALAVIIAEIVRDKTLPEALVIARACLRKHVHHEETEQALAQAQRLAASPIESHVAIAQLGQGWVAEEALAIAVYCALTAPTFIDGVIHAVNHDGDSDSTGAMTGHILGALHGQAVVPESFLAPLELRDVITEIASDLCVFREWDIGECEDVGGRSNRALSETVWQKYPGF